MGPGGFPESKQSELDVDHSLQCSAEVKNEWSYNCAPPMRLHEVDILPFTVYKTDEVKFNTLRTRSFKLFKRPFPGFLTILTL